MYINFIVEYYRITVGPFGGYYDLCNKHGSLLSLNRGTLYIIQHIPEYF